MAPSPSTLRAVLKGAVARPMESTFVTWIAVVILSHQLERFLSSKRKTDESSKATVSIRGKKFNVSEGAASNLSWSGVPEFYMTVVLQLFETFGLWRLGAAHFRIHPKTGVGKPPMTRLALVLWAAFTLMPVLDTALPSDWSNPLPEDQKRARNQLRFRVPLYIWTALAFAGTYKTITTLANPRNGFTLRDKLGAVGLMSIFSGLSINTAHELVHKPSGFEQALGNALLVNTNYVHWGLEHTDGHHEHVATPLDPATARLGETPYGFVPRSIVGSWLSAARIEARMAEENMTPWWRRLATSKIVWGALAPAAWAATIARGAGPGKGARDAVLMFYAQALGGVTFLELVNYVEHYGLERRLLEDGRTYEPVDPTHSWNAPHRMSNAFLFKLQRHSDHHTFAVRPYHLLRNFKESPQLPSGYPGMLGLALVPPLFRYIMDPLVKANERRRDPDADPEEWEQAQRTANSKMAVFSGLLFAGATTALAKTAQAL